MRMHYIPWTANHHAYATDSVKMSRDQETMNTWVGSYLGSGKYGGTDVSGSF